MAQPVISLPVELSDEALLRLLRAGGVTATSERHAKRIGQAIGDAGAEFLFGVVNRNRLSDKEVARCLRKVRVALGSVNALVGSHDAAVVTTDAMTQRAAAISLLLDPGLPVRSALRAEAGAEAADRVDRALVEMAWLEERWRRSVTRRSRRVPMPLPLGRSRVTARRRSRAASRLLSTGRTFRAPKQGGTKSSIASSGGSGICIARLQESFLVFR